MSLLDGDEIRNLFGAVLSPLYGDGRLIRRKMIRQSTGVVLPVYSQPVPIKVQVDRLDSSMRAADHSDTDVKLLVLQAGVPGGVITTDDVIETRGLRRWNMFAVGEDPARSYWRGRGVRVATKSDTLGWLLEFGSWDDGGSWMDSAPWTESLSPVLRSMENWDTLPIVMNTLAGLLSAAGVSAATNWASTRSGLNTALGSASMEQILDGEKASASRAKINQLVEILL